MSFDTKIIKGLEDINGNAITDMGANWETKPYSFENLLHLAAQIYWSDPAIEGDMYLEYTCDSRRDRTSIDLWETFQTVNLDGTFRSVLFLDANLAVASYRIRFVHSSGSGSVDARIVGKNNKL